MKNHAKHDWRKYNRKPVNRGSTTLWLEEEALSFPNTRTPLFEPK